MPWGFLACGGHVMPNGGDLDASGPSDSAALDGASNDPLDGAEATADAGCSARLDADIATITDFEYQHKDGSCQKNGDCTVFSILGTCLTASIAQFGDVQVVASKAVQDFEEAGCAMPSSISCDSFSARCAGDCIFAGPVALPVMH